MEIELKKIQIEKILWGDKKGGWNGKVEFSIGESTFDFKIPDHRIKEMLRLIKPDIFAGINEVGSQAISELENFLNS